MTQTAELVPIGRAIIEKAEKDLGPLTVGERSDLLLDNILELKGVKEAHELLAEIFSPVACVGMEPCCEVCGVDLPAGYAMCGECKVEKGY
jgi:hypothetical protein